MCRQQSTEHCTNITAVLAVIFPVIFRSVVMNKCRKVDAFRKNKKKTTKKSLTPKAMLHKEEFVHGLLSRTAAKQNSRDSKNRRKGVFKTTVQSFLHPLKRRKYIPFID